VTSIINITSIIFDGIMLYRAILRLEGNPQGKLLSHFTQLWFSGIGP